MEANEVIEEIKPLCKGAEEFVEGQISPCLGVHTGPGLVGMGYFVIE